MTQPIRVQLNLSQAFNNKNNLAENRWNAKDKEYNNKWAFGYSFHPHIITLDEWAQHIASGKAFTMGYYEGNSRRKETFKSSQILGLDFDDNTSVEDCKNDPLLAQYAYLLYPTPSSTPECRKTRAMIVLSEPVTDAHEWERLQRGLIWQYQNLNPDGQCKDAARLFFGSTQEGHEILGRIMPIEQARDYAANMEAEIGVLQPERTTEDNTRIREQNRANLADDKKRTRYYNYAAKSLDYACSQITMASQGDKHAAIFRYSAYIGNHIGANMIGESECFSALVSAGLATGYKQNEVERVVRDALRAGISKPTDTHELDRQWDEKVKAWKKERAKQRANETPEDLFGHVIRKAQSEQIQHASLLTKLHNKYIHTSWFENDIPFAFMCAMLHLTDSRSETAVIFLKLHGAFLYGLLNPGAFTLQDVMNIYPQFTRKVIATALSDLYEMNFVTDLKTPSTTIVVSLDRVNKSESKRGRPPKQYCICDMKTLTERIPMRLKQALEIYYREKFQYHVISELTPQLAMQMGIEDYETLKTLRDGTKLGMFQDKLSKQAQWRYKQEIEGDGRDWRGWEYAFENAFTIPFDWNVIDTVRDLRAAILKYWITEVRQVNTQTELTRLIGCSSATLSSIYRDYDIETTKQYHRETLTPDQIGKDLRITLQRLQQKYRGVVWEVKFKYQYLKGWQPCKVEGAAMHYAMNVDRKEHPIESVLIMLVMPSAQRVLTPKEIAKRDKELTEADTKTVKTVTKVTSSTPLQRKTMKPSRQWLGHDFEYLYQWTQTLTYTFSDSLELLGNTVIDTRLYAPGNDVLKTHDLGAVLRFVVSHNPTMELKRSSADFQGKEDIDYNSEVSAYFKQKREDEMAQIEADNEKLNWQEIHRQAELIEVPF